MAALDARSRDHFRLLRTLADLAHAERLQEEVFGVSERDLIPANELIVVPETGGAVIAVFLPEDPDRAVGILVGWGGFVGRPRIVSDFLAIRSEARSLGLATELKRLQAAIALSRGFAEIVWTVDPLRAANARLNFGKLGATAHRYEIDRYGATFATTLYGGLPTDRLHITWDILSPRVISRLLGQEETQQPAGDTRPCPIFARDERGHRPRRDPRRYRCPARGQTRSSAGVATTHTGDPAPGLRGRVRHNGISTGAR